MKKLIGDNFCEVEKYKLYRTVHEIIHPTISKRNISNYKVVFDEKMLPVLVFYPKKVSDISSAIIYVPGDGLVSGSYGKYANICNKIAKESNSLVIAIDYFDRSIKCPTIVNKVYKIIKYLYAELENNGIYNENITLMGDSTGCIILSGVVSKMIDRNISVNKMIMFYPVVRDDYSNYSWNETCKSINFNLDKRINEYLKKLFSKSVIGGCSLLEKEDLSYFPKTLIVTGDMDILRDDGKELALKFMRDVEGSKYCNIKFASHGFLMLDNEEILNETYKEICDF